MRYHLVAGTTNTDSHALVWGSGLAGLLAARVLVDHFAQVTVIDSPVTMTDHQPLTMRGQRLLERLFPGITTQLILAGAPGISWTADCPLLLPGGWLPRFPADFSSRLASPVLVERIVRQRVQEYGGSRLSFDQSSITGYAQRGHYLLGLKRTGNTIMPGQVVVNTTRHQPFNLTSAVPMPTGIHLTSALFQPASHFFADWKALLLWSDFQPLQGGWLVPLEDQRWLVTLFGQPAHLPTHEQGFTSFAHKLRHPALSEALQSATPMADTYRQHALTLRNYPVNQGHWPHNLLVLSGTPGIFEMEQAVINAVALSETLREQRRTHPGGDLTGLARRFQTRLQHTSPVPGWLIPALFNTHIQPYQRLVKNTVYGCGQRIVAAAPADTTLARLIWQTVQQETTWLNWLTPGVIAKALQRPSSAAAQTLPTAPASALPTPAPRKISTAELAAIVDVPER